MTQQLPSFTDMPDNYGIETSHDGGFYPYRYDESDRCHYIKNEQGLDLRCRSWEEAMQAIREQEGKA